MKELKIFELFAGIGSPRKALTNLEIPYKSMGYSEIDQHAVKSYCAIHGDTEENNFGDITKIKELPKDLDLVFHGSPCQDFSIAGLMKGADLGSGTRSSLMWDTVRLVGTSRPKVVIWENVKAVLNKKNIHNFNKYLETLEVLGYKNSYKILNAVDYGIPQNRERLIVVSTLGEKFDFENLEKKEMIKIQELLEIYNTNDVDKIIKINQATKKGYAELETPGIANLSFPTSKTRRGRVINKGKICPTIQTTNELYLFYNDNKKKLTSRELYLLMGFSEEDHFKVKNICSENQLIKQAGNSIVVNVLEAIFKEVFKSYSH